MVREDEISIFGDINFAAFIFLHTFTDRKLTPNSVIIQRYVFPGKFAIWIMIFCYNGQFLLEKLDFSAYCAEIQSL